MDNATEPLTTSPVGRKTTPTRGVRKIWREQAINLAAIILAALPSFTPAAAAVRLVFPATAFVFAGWMFFTGRASQYLNFCFWLFLLTPFVRRLVDFHAGYADLSYLLLAPYASGIFALLLLPRLIMARKVSGQLPVLGVLICVYYGFAIAVLSDRVAPGFYDFLRWAVPPALASFILLHEDLRDELTEAFGLVCLTALPVLSLYGLYQFVAVPPWDALWMVGSKMDSIGFPRPFELRVFSTLNSPGSFAFYEVALILVNINLKNPVRFVGLLLGVAALGATLVRSAWLPLGLGIVFLLVFGSWRARSTIGVAIACAICAFPLALASPQLEKTVVQRATTIADLSRDKSASDRAQAYRTMTNELEGHLQGEGLAISGTYAGGDTARIIDGGPIEILLSFGVVFGILYCACIVTIGLGTLVAPSKWLGPVAESLKGVLLALGVALSSGTTVSGEVGFLFWTAAGLVLVHGRSRLAR